MADYREHGSSGLDREAAALYADDDALAPVSQEAVEHAARHARLVALHGKPEPFDPVDALDVIGLAGEYHPGEVVAFTHRDLAGAAAFGASNREHHGHLPLASVPHKGRVLGVTLLAPFSGRTGAVVAEYESAGCAPDTAGALRLSLGGWTQEDVERFEREWAALHAPRPAGPYCARCGYRVDAPGHVVCCG